MKAGAVAAPSSGSSSSSSAVAFAWEEEPGVSKQSPAEAKKPARADAVSRRTTTPAASAKKQAPTTAATTAHPHSLRVPPPPGGPGAPAVSPPGKSKRRSRGVRPADDPFLAAYLACTEDGRNGGRGYSGAQKLLGWAGLGLGLGLGMRGLGLSCKSSCGAVESQKKKKKRSASSGSLRSPGSMRIESSTMFLKPTLSFSAVYSCAFQSFYSSVERLKG